jgi:hypothetical protein
MSDYPVGTIALATVRGVEGVRVMAGEGLYPPKLRWVTTDPRLVDSGNDGWYFDYDVTDVRPLVLLDLDTIGASSWKVVADNLRTTGCRIARENIADQIEAQTKPPKPDEPTGLGAVVEDAGGDLWLRTEKADFPWRRPAKLQNGRVWRTIDAVRVLSEGWTE